MDRFFNYVDKTDSCWIWTGGKRRRGYGMFNAGNGRNISAHRYSYEIHNGEIPDGMCILHKCDRPECVNPAHLFAGTLSDNMLDMLNKGRNGNGQTKLTPEIVRNIRKAYACGGMTYVSLGNKFGIDRRTARDIVIRRHWKNV